MEERHTRPALGRTRWRRFAAVTVPAVVATGGIFFGMANGAIAAAFSVSGGTFKVGAADLVGTGFVQYGGLAGEVGAATDQTKVHPVAIAGIGSADITKMCQSVTIPNTPWGIRLTAGDLPGAPAKATGLMFDMTDMKGDATFEKLNIGQDASTLSKAGKDNTGKMMAGKASGFGQEADTVHLVNVQQTAWAASAGTFTLPNLHLQVFTDGAKNECF